MDIIKQSNKNNNLSRPHKTLTWQHYSGQSQATTTNTEVQWQPSNRNKTPSSSHPAALTSKRPLQNSGLLCEHKGPPGRTVRMTHRVTCKSYQPGSATKPTFRSPTQAVAALTRLWNCTGRTQEGNPGLSHIVFLSRLVYLFI